MILESFGMHIVECADFISGLGWPREQWAMQILIRLAEIDFKSVSKWVETELDAFAASFFSSLIIEQMNNAGRARASSNRKGALEPKAL